jgi:hypothetical protein
LVFVFLVLPLKNDTAKNGVFALDTIQAKSFQWGFQGAAGDSFGCVGFGLEYASNPEKQQPVNG